MRAGLSLFRARAYGAADRTADAEAAADEFRDLVPFEVAQMFERQLAEWRRAPGEPATD